MNSDSNFIEKIDSYLQGELTSKEAEAFEQQLNADPELRLYLISVQNVTEGIKGYTFKKKIADFHNEYLTTKRKKTVQLYWLSGIAASFVFVLIAYFYLFFTPSSHYYAYFEPYASPVNVRSGNQSNAFQSAVEYYDRGEYDRAIAEFKKLGPEASTEEARFYMAVSYLAQHHPESALSVLLSVKGEQYAKQAKWYLSLCYLLTNEKEKAKATLKKILPGDYNYSRAQEILITL